MVVALGSLLTWLWQGTAVALGAAGVLRFGARFNAATRYLVLWASLLAVLLLAPGALLSRMGGTGLDASHVSLAPAAEPHVLRAPATLLPIELPLVPVWFGIALVATWASSAGLRLHAMRKSLTRMRHIKRVCAPLAGNIETQLPLWRSIRRRGRRARLCVSSEVGVASMLGLGQPTIVIPRSLVAALASDELDRIVVHEYGHVQRWDDWTNLIQLTIEAVAGWHPAIWWIGRALRLEREVACDDRRIVPGEDRRPGLAAAGGADRTGGNSLGARADAAGRAVAGPGSERDGSAVLSSTRGGNRSVGNCGRHPQPTVTASGVPGPGGPDQFCDRVELRPDRVPRRDANAYPTGPADRPIIRRRATCVRPRRAASGPPDDTRLGGSRTRAAAARGRSVRHPAPPPTLAAGCQPPAASPRDIVTHAPRQPAQRRVTT